MALSSNPTNLSILYFIKQMVPTKEEAFSIAELDFPVKVRNAAASAGETPEPCDGVMGAVPIEYEGFPHGPSAISEDKKNRKAKIKAMREDTESFELGAVEKALSDDREIERSRVLGEEVERQKKGKKGDAPLPPWDPNQG